MPIARLATTYTVVGVMNKMLTVTVNVLIWDKHASASGIGALCVCLLGGSLYQQAPLKESPNSAEGVALTSVVSDDERDSRLTEDTARGSSRAAQNEKEGAELARC